MISRGGQTSNGTSSKQAERALRAGSPLVLEVADRMRVRLVFGQAELRERLILWEAGLDDSIVECVKLLHLRDAPELRRVGTRIHVEAVMPGGDLEMATSAARWTPRRRSWRRW